VELDDRIVIATPEGVDLELTLAGVGSRFAAALVDTIVQGLVMLGLAIVLLLGLGGLGRAIYYVAAFLVWFGYHVLFEVLASGRTPGKRWTGIRVVRVGGHPVTFLPSATRNILRLVDALPAVYLVGCVSILVTQRNQRLGDLAAGTLVIRDRRAADRPELPRRSYDFTASSAGPDEVAAWDVSAVTAEELAAVRRFLERRHELDPHARHHLAWQLFDRLRPKTAGVPEGIAGERFLELLERAKAARV
jgi:uncharacterized RDD family membrane protein YckC